MKKKFFQAHFFCRCNWSYAAHAFVFEAVCEKKRIRGKKYHMRYWCVTWSRYVCWAKKKEMRISLQNTWYSLHSARSQVKGSTLSCLKNAFECWKDRASTTLLRNEEHLTSRRARNQQSDARVSPSYGFTQKEMQKRHCVAWAIFFLNNYLLVKYLT